MKSRRYSFLNCASSSNNFGYWNLGIKMIVGGTHFKLIMHLKEHCTQKKIWIHLMQNIFRNQTVNILTILDNPFKRYDFSKFSLNSMKSLCRPHKLATVPCHGCTTPHWFCTQIITKFSIFLDMSKAVDQTHSKKHTDSYLPQTNMINK